MRIAVFTALMATALAQPTPMVMLEMENSPTDSKGKYNCYVSQGTTAYVPGHLGMAFDFDGATRIMIQAAGGMPEVNFGVSLWAKTTSGGGMFGVHSQVGQHDRHFSIVSGGKVKVRVWPWGATETAVTNAADGSWHNLVYSFGDPGCCGQYIWLDGTAISHVGYKTHSTYHNDNEAYVGWNQDDGYFTGAIDEVYIYNVRLDDNDVAALQPATPTAAPSPAPTPSPTFMSCKDIGKLWTGQSTGLTPTQVFDECKKAPYCKAKFRKRKNKAKCKKIRCKKCKNMACCTQNPEGCVYNPVTTKCT